MVSLRVCLRTLAVSFLCAFLSVAVPAQETRDPKAVAVAESMMEAMGGQKAWNNTHYIRYDFVVKSGTETRASRSHLWDKWTGLYRLEQTTKDGKQSVVLFNANTQQGTAYLDGKTLTGDDAAKAVKGAYGTFINDMYWLSMPWKWMDAGVNLKYVGERQYKGATADVVELSFGKVGLTPGDRYRAFVSRANKLMTHWEYTLQSGNKGSWDWEYTLVGGIRLARTHTNAEGMEISMGNVRVFRELDPAYFIDPAKGLSNLK